MASPDISLYAFDDSERCAIFVETPPAVKLTAFPFFHTAQTEHATRLFTLPYDAFNALADGLLEPKLALLYSVGRCGSTLLSNALGQLGNVLSLSEPDAYHHATGMREADGSRDAELTQLLRSATRFLCSKSDTSTWLIKFRGYSVEIADLMARAHPEARTLFLYRDLPSWLRSMGRVGAVRERERQASPVPVTPPYPRDRYIPLLRTLPAPPETRLLSAALGWTSMMRRYLELHDEGILPHALRYSDLIAAPTAALEAVSRIYDLPNEDMTAALGAFGKDSQEGTRLSRVALEGAAGDLEPDDLERAVALAKRYTLEPNPRLPGDLFGGASSR